KGQALGFIPSGLAPSRVSTGALQIDRHVQSGVFELSAGRPPDSAFPLSRIGPRIVAASLSRWLRYGGQGAAHLSIPDRRFGGALGQLDARWPPSRPGILGGLPFPALDGG